MENVLAFPRRLGDGQPADAEGPHAPPSGAGPGEVGLYGLGYYTLPILEMCRDAGIRVAFVVDDYPEAHPDYPPASTCLRSVLEALGAARVPVWTNPEFCRQLERKAPLPALVASSIVNRMGGSVSTDPYLRSARLVREISGGGRRLLHPVVLATRCGCRRTASASPSSASPAPATSWPSTCSPNSGNGSTFRRRLPSREWRRSPPITTSAPRPSRRTSCATWRRSDWN